MSECHGLTELDVIKRRIFWTLPLQFATILLNIGSSDNPGARSVSCRDREVFQVCHKGLLEAAGERKDIRPECEKVGSWIDCDDAWNKRRDELLAGPLVYLKVED
jgi:hypothetical protein